jgi:hypothetical protein
MSYTISPSDDNSYIIVKVKGTITRQTAMQQNLEAHALGRRLQISRYLVDVTEARNTDSVIQNYEFAYTDMKNTPGIDRSARVAVLVSPGDHSHDFVVTAAKNSGLVVEIFTELDLAKQYLMDK